MSDFPTSEWYQQVSKSLCCYKHKILGAKSGEVKVQSVKFTTGLLR